MFKERLRIKKTREVEEHEQEIKEIQPALEAMVDDLEDEPLRKNVVVQRYGFQCTNETQRMYTFCKSRLSRETLDKMRKLGFDTYVYEEKTDDPSELIVHFSCSQSELVALLDSKFDLESRKPSNNSTMRA
jgi:hypothetical protein